MNTPELRAAAAPPMGIGRFGPRWIATCLALLVLVGLGALGYAQQRLHGDVVTGMRTIGQGGPAWALYICFDVVFVGLAFAGIAVTTITRIFRIKELWPLSRMGELLAVVSLMMAGMCVVADLGRPLHGLINLPKYARTISPFFGTFTLVIGAGLTASLVYLFLDGRSDAAVCLRAGARPRWLFALWSFGVRGTAAEQMRHRRVSQILSLLMLPLLVVAYSTLGFVFGIQGGRPGWFSALQAPGFVVLAAISGTGVLIAIAGGVRSLLGLQDRISTTAFRWLGRALAIEILIYLYFIAVEELTARYASSQAQNEVAQAIEGGTYSGLFWCMIAALLVALVLLVVRSVRHSLTPAVAVTAGLVVQVAAVLKRYLIVVPSQTHGTLLPWPTGSYTPSWVELAVVTGLTALGALVYLVVLKLVPIVPLESAAVLDWRAATPESAWRRVLRRTLFVFTLGFGLGLAAIGFAASARFGTRPYLDPVLPFSPVIFIVGLVLSLFAAVVFELLPWSRADAAGRDASPSGAGGN